ncbi:MAG: tRNA guanosine(34) transglycosylase Tgt [Flavobacteriales bacterium]|nr:tRNA guanosine(34) transglycosylase Tgt [Flavobacteriales bacterium]
MKFRLDITDSKTRARAGILETDHGSIATPIFMPVGTAGTVKGLYQQQLSADVQAQIILGNTYHLYLRPGMDVIADAGGLHRFMGWEGPILTDSGGYQVFSLSEIRKIKEEGATFTSHIDGSRHFFSPEHAIDVQRTIGADIIMAFDECTPYPCEYDQAKKSMELTHRWLDRSYKQFTETEPRYGYEQSLFPIVQGSVYPDLREKSAAYVAGLDCAGNAIGGLSVGEPHEDMYAMTDMVCRILPEHKPRYLMGVGTPVNLLECISLGIDMFDCVMPTRNARNGLIYTMDGMINIRNEKWKNDHTPLDPGGDAFVDRQYTRSYVRHLHISGEMLGAMITSLHNLRFYLRLMEEARRHILAGDFALWKADAIRSISKRL